jgi:hypothetical protein
MILHCLKRTVKNEDGSRDISLIPVFPDDIKKIDKIKDGVIQKVETIVKRRPETIGKVWALCAYFVNNLPEQLEKVDEMTGERVPVFMTARHLYEWLKLTVGFVDIVGQYKIPKETKFVKLEDEEEFIRDFQEPAIQQLARMAGMTKQQLIEVSKQWKTEKTSTKKW